MHLLDLPGELLPRIFDLLTSLDRIRLLGACRRLDTLALLRERDGQLLALDCPSLRARALRASGLAFLLRRAGPGLRGVDLTAPPCCWRLRAEELLAALEQPCAEQLRILVALRPSFKQPVGVFFSPQQAARLAAALPNLGRGSVLGLGQSCAYNQGISQLPPALAALRGCEMHVKLTWGSEATDSEIAAHVKAATAGAPGTPAGLSYLSWLGPLSWPEVVAAVRPGLLTLQLAGSIDTGRMQALAGALRENNTTLTRLQLQSNKNRTGVQVLAGALRKNTTLTSLDLIWNDIGDAGAQALAVLLRENATLSELVLKLNQIGEAGGSRWQGRCARTPR